MPPTRKPHEAPKDKAAAAANRFRAEHRADGKELHLYILGPIADMLWWGDEVTPKAVQQALAAKGDADSVHVHLNSYGGSVIAGIAIFNLLRNSGLRVVASVEGIAASAASLILMAGDERHVPENAFVMVHNPWTYAVGESEDLRKTADTLDQIAGALVATYAKRAGLDEDEVKGMLDAETWLNGKEALAKGLATHTDAAVEIAAAVRPVVGRAASGLPAALAAALEEDDDEEPEDDEDDPPPPKPEDDDEEDGEEEEAKALAAAQQQVTDLRASLATAKVDLAIAQGRIRADAREAVLAAALKADDADALLAAWPKAGGADPVRMTTQDAQPSFLGPHLQRVADHFRTQRHQARN